MKLFKYRFFTLSLLMAMVCSFPSTTNAQNRDGIGLHLVGIDYFALQGGNYFTNEVHQNIYNTDSNRYDLDSCKKLLWAPGVRLSYLHEFTEKFDLLVGLTGSGAVVFPNSEDDSTYADYMLNHSGAKDYTKRYYFNLEFRGNYNFIGHDHFVNPYLGAGFALNFFNEAQFGFSIPLAFGLDFNLTKERDLFLNWESNYVLGLGDDNFSRLHHLIGFKYYWNKGQEVVDPPPPPPPPPPPAPLDTDGDGINDDVDRCPEVAGVASLGGCPDADGDGISDAEDKCPSIKGIVKYAGCPIPDTDGDGFNDEVDKCPNVASPENNGCPVVKQEVIEKIEEAGGQVHFQSSKSVLTVDSDENLDIIAGLLRDNPSYKCDIEGHTDASGNYEFNKKLSEDRAKVCYDYLVAKGIDPSRLTHKGFGPDVPVATNDTKEGRAKNRRTEFKLHL